MYTLDIQLLNVKLYELREKILMHQNVGNLKTQKNSHKSEECTYPQHYPRNKKQPNFSWHLFIALNFDNTLHEIPWKITVLTTTQV